MSIHDDDAEDGVVEDGVDQGSLPGSQRLDKWLWFARIVRTRTLSQALVSEGKVRVNLTKVDKPGYGVKVGDTITVALRERIRILKIRSFCARRGGAEAALALYEDLAPLPPKGSPEAEAARLDDGQDAHREAGSGRPTKRERRQIDRFKSRST